MPNRASESRVEIFTKCLHIDWLKDGDELFEHLGVALQQLVTMEGYQQTRHFPEPDDPDEYTVMTVQSIDLPSKLHIFQDDERKVRLFVVHDDLTQLASQSMVWCDAFTEAFENLGSKIRKFPWIAAIAPGGRYSRHKLTGKGAEIGGMRIEITGKTYFDINRPQVPSMNALDCSWTYPVVVKGVAEGYRWDQASMIAIRDLGTLCALVSVALESFWTVIQVPSLSAYSSGTLPESRPGALVESGLLDHVETQIPPWVNDDAWNRVVGDEILLRALHIHHQGLELADDFPSFALLAHVACIEALGAKLNPPEKCQCCDDCPAIVKSTQRFAAALKLVTSDEVFDYLKKAYDSRSKTAHEGHLFGGEFMNGVPIRQSLFGPPSKEFEFLYNELRMLRMASAYLITHFAVSG